MNHFTRPGDTSRRSRRWIPFIMAGIIISGVLVLGQTQLGAVSKGNPANIETARQFFNHLNGDPFVAAVELFTDDAAIHTPEGKFQGPIGAADFVATLDEAFPNASFTIRRLEIANELVTAQWTMTGKQYGDYQGLSPSCAAVTMSGVAIIRFEDQLIDEQWIHYDRLALVRQIESFNQIDAGSRPGCRNR